MKSLKHLILPIAFGLLAAVIYVLNFNNPTIITDLKNSASQWASASQPTPLVHVKLSFANAVEKAAPSVVTIYTQRFSSDSRDSSNTPLQANLGSGVIITANGLIITNHHVIQDAANILVHLRDGRSASAIVVGEDKETDIAILKIPFRNLQKMELRASTDLRVGDVVLAIGNPLNVGQTVTMGIISATGRNRVGINTYENFIQTDASINPGNSGGALIDTQGNMIGLNTAIFSQSGGSQGIGFAIPTNLVLNIMQELLKNGRISRGWFGVNGINAKELDANGKSKGVLIVDVFDQSPAFKAGLKTADIITHINKEKIFQARDVVDQVASLKPGSTINVTIERALKAINYKLLITERPIE